MKRWLLCLFMSMIVASALSQEKKTTTMDSFLDPASCKTYIIKDYTRFSTLQEILIEYVREIRWRDDRMEILCTDDDGISFHFSKAGLFLVDGKPIKNNRLLLDMDPAGLESIRVYPDCYLVDGIRYDGVVNFITMRNVTQATNQIPKPIRAPCIQSQDRLESQMP